MHVAHAAPRMKGAQIVSYFIENNNKTWSEKNEIIRKKPISGCLFPGVRMADAIP